MAMMEMTLSMPKPLLRWAEARAAEQGFACVGDYLCDLIRQDRDREERRRPLQAAIDEGLASGVSERDAFEIIEEHRAALRNIERGSE